MFDTSEIWASATTSGWLKPLRVATTVTLLVACGGLCTAAPPLPGTAPCDVVADDHDAETQSRPSANAIVIATGEHKPYLMTSAENGVLFDLDAGDLDRAAWTDPDSDTDFLAFDQNRVRSGLLRA